jgi:hypothetical protein
MSNRLSCLRRTEPSEALIPRPGQRTLAYVPAARSDIRKRIHEFNQHQVVALEARPASRFAVRSMQTQPRLNGDAALLEIAHVPA